MIPLVIALLRYLSLLVSMDPPWHVLPAGLTKIMIVYKNA